MPGRRARGQNIKRLFGINILNTAFAWHAFDFTPRARVQAVGTELWRAEQGTHRPPRSDRFSGVPALWVLDPVRSPEFSLSSFIKARETPISEANSSRC